MNEIPKNPQGNPSGITQQTKVESVDTAKVAEITAPVVNEKPEKEIKDITNDPTRLAMVKADSLEADLKFFQDHPEKVGLAMHYFKMAYETLQNETEGKNNKEQDSYPKATAFMGSFTNEFLK